ncbi:MAG: TlpA family protein disulfide reductase [Nannocystaceae bacterium]|nr:TlpA family protein disulfide reductase [Nannocystaceae bacterium]
MSTSEHPGGSLGIRLPSIDGQDVSLAADDPNDVFVLAFWATWCQPCQSELTKLQGMYDARRDKGLKLYAVSIDGPDTQSEVVGWSRREGYTFPVLLDGETEILGRYNPKGDIPFYVVLDANGTVLRSHQGYVDGDVAELAHFVDEQLARERE